MTKQPVSLAKLSQDFDECPAEAPAVEELQPAISVGDDKLQLAALKVALVNRRALLCASQPGDSCTSYL